MNIKIINLSNFIKLIDGKQLFCIGAGKGADRFCLVLSAFFECKHITAFVDNDENKWGGQKEIEGGQVNIISIHDMVKQMRADAVIVITCTDVAGIGAQLESIPELEETGVYIYYDILDRNNGDIVQEWTIRQSKEAVIPKVIHYCWFGRKNIPDTLKEWMKSWKKYCPDYDIVEWNEDNYDISKNMYMKQAYDAKMWGFVPDYARLDIIYNHGGIYLDTDVELLKNLDELLYQEGYCGEINKLVNLGLGFGARKGLPIIGRLRDYYDDVLFTNEQGKSDLTTCVVHQFRVLKGCGYIPDGKYQCVEGFTVFPAGILADFNFFAKHNNVTDTSFSLHHCAGSWVPIELKNNRLKNRRFLATRGMDSNEK